MPSSSDYPSVAANLQPFIDNQTVPGIVTLLATKDKILSLNAAGYADVEAKKPMRTDSLCWVASMNKSMTAAAVMILVDEGKVRLDDPVEKYLPEFKPQWYIEEQDEDHMLLKHPQSTVIVRNLLTHTSGFPYSTGVEQPTLDMVDLASRVYDYVSTPLLFEPGTKNSYSNAGINTAGRIVEVVSGLSYGEFMKERLFKPCGMVDATFRMTTRQLERVPVTYAANLGDRPWAPMEIAKLHYPLDDPARQPVPGNGLFATALDSARFCQMLLSGGLAYDGHRVLSEDAVRTMTTKQTPDAVPNEYGLGLAIDPNGYGHGGSDHTFMHVNPQRGLISELLVQMYTSDEKRMKLFLDEWNSQVASYPVG